MTTPFHTAFRDELLRAADREGRRRRRQRRTVRTAVAAVLAVILGTGALLGLPDPAAADVEVRFASGYIEVSLRGPLSSATDLRDALAEHGVDVRVEAIPTGPSAVGRITAVQVDVRAGAPQPELLDPVGVAFSRFRVREDLAGRLVVQVGRAAEAGEPYDAFTDAFAEGEVLHCRGVLGEPLVEAAERLGRLTVTVRTGSEDQVESLELDAALRGPARTQLVVGGIATADRQVQLTVAPEPVAEERGC